MREYSTQKHSKQIGKLFYSGSEGKLQKGSIKANYRWLEVKFKYLFED